MERHAHFALVGVISCLLLVAGLVFVVWLGQFQFEHEYDLYRVVFQGTVRGLSDGGDVQFNGIKIGMIQHIALDRTNPTKVIALIRTEGGTPVRVDSLATTELQGISGIAVIQISAGTVSKPLLREIDNSKRPTIKADPHVLPSIEQGGGQVLLAATEALNRINRVLSDRNVANVDRAVSDLRSTADELAEHRAMFARLDHAVGEIDAAAGGVKRIANGDATHAFADLATAASDLKNTVHTAHGVVARFDSQSGVIASTTLPRVNATLDSLHQTSDALNNLIRDIRDDPRGTLGKPRAQELEVHP